MDEQVTTLEAMGFPREEAKRAVEATGGSAEGSWIREHVVGKLERLTAGAGLSGSW